MVYLVEMRLERLDISCGCTETCGCGNFFKPMYRLLNSSVFLIIKNSPKQLGIFMIISNRKGAMYFSRLFFPVLEFFAWQIVILQEWKKFITIWEWPSSELRKHYLILIIRYCSLTYRHQPIYGTSRITKLMKKSKYQNIVLCGQTIFVLSYQTCVTKK